MTAPAVLRAPRRARQIKTQPFRILVASAAGPSSLGAIRVATALARRRSASVHALIAVPPFPNSVASILAAAPPPIADEHGRRSALEGLRRQLATVRGTGAWTMRATTGFPAESVLAAAARWPASIVIMGTGEHGLATRIIGSEVSVKVATWSTIPVLAVPADAQALPTRAVAAIDFSEASIAAAMLAATLLGPNGSLTLLYASPLIVEHSAAGSLTDLYTTGARDRLAEIAATVQRRTKRPVGYSVTTGTIVDRLLDFVHMHDHDLVTLGANESTLLERMFVEPVRTRVLRAVPCAVLVVPSSRDEP